MHEHSHMHAPHYPYYSKRLHERPTSYDMLPNTPISEFFSHHEDLEISLAHLPEVVGLCATALSHRQMVVLVTTRLEHIVRFLVSVYSGPKKLGECAEGLWYSYHDNWSVISNLVQGTANSSIYKNLAKGQIRVLRLQPGSGSDPLQATLEYRDLRDVRGYDALSYHWGSDSPGYEGDMSLHNRLQHLTPNLHAGLCALRLPDQCRYIWIDYLCIDQSNFEEKHTQISMMGDIYRSANKVLVWLGTEDEASEVGMSALKFFLDSTSLANEAPWYSIQAEDSALGLSSILKRDWWYRMWTVQEAVLAREVVLICGSHSVRWDTDLTSLLRIKFMVQFAVTTSQWQYSPLQKVDLQPLVEVIEAQIREREEEGGPKVETNILDLRYRFRHRKCTYESDKLFALLGLARGRSLQFQNPDIVSYTKTTEQAQGGIARVLKELYPEVEVPPDWMFGYL